MNIFKTPNHKHPFIKVFKDDGWKCDGAMVFGKCKSNLDKYNKSFGKTRYKCRICDDFDFCQLCLCAPKVEENSKKNIVASLVNQSIVKLKYSSRIS